MGECETCGHLTIYHNECGCFAVDDCDCDQLVYGPGR